MKTNEILIRQFENDLTTIYGPQFISDLQELCHITELKKVFGKKAMTKSLETKYLNMLRGAFYAAYQIKVTK